MDLLGGGDSDSGDNNAVNGFKINRKYAKSYETWRKKEEKQKLLDKYGDDFDSSSDSDEEITSSKKLDKEWLRAYAVVRFNQPRLYSGEKLFNEEATAVGKKVEKKVTLKDHERKFVLEKGGVASEDEEEGDFQSKNGKTYFEEQEEIKDSFKKVIGDSDEDDADDQDDSLLVRKAKTKDEQKQEENDYLAWLKGETDDLEDTAAAEELAPLKALWSDPNLTDKERILRDYILNNGYMDKEGSDDDESDDDAFDFDGEEEFLDQADKYEQTYNFRHEEPGGIEIKTYPRVIETSVRAKEENKRAEKRKRKLEKKQKEKEERMEEIKTLQRLQREEKEQKIQKLRDLSENPDLEYDLDADFDPDEHNKMMKKYFDDSYYNDGDGTEKPVFEPDEDGTFEDESDDWWQNRTEAQNDMEGEMVEDEGGNELYADDPNFVMDDDYDPGNVEKMKKSKKQSKKEKKKDKKKGKLEKLPLFDPTTKSFDEYLDEYLKDKINTLPFTYREVVPNDFGLSTNEILTAPDRELNSWVSVKKMSMYRADHEENNDIHKFQMKASNTYKKHKVLPSLGPKQKIETPDIKVKKKKKEKSGKFQEDETVKEDDTVLSEPIEEVTVTEKSPEGKKKDKSKKRKRAAENEEGADEVTTDTQKSKKKKIKHHDNFKQEETIIRPKEKTNSKTSETSEGRKKKKKGSKVKNESTENGESQELPNPKELLVTEKTGSTKEEAPVKTKKNKKKKSKLKLDDSEAVEHKPVVTDKKKVKKNLRKVMSVSRLGSYGLAPSDGKHANKKKKKNRNE